VAQNDSRRSRGTVREVGGTRFLTSEVLFGAEDIIC
jgi:hypothetical protein